MNMVSLQVCYYHLEYIVIIIIIKGAANSAGSKLIMLNGLNFYCTFLTPSHCSKNNTVASHSHSRKGGGGLLLVQCKAGPHWKQFRVQGLSPRTQPWRGWSGIQTSDCSII